MTSDSLIYSAPFSNVILSYKTDSGIFQTDSIYHLSN